MKSLKLKVLRDSLSGFFHRCCV